MATILPIHNVTSSEPYEEPVTLGEVKRHLRVMHSDLDTEIRSLIREARDWFERTHGKTLRLAVTRTTAWGCWPSGPIYPAFPPLKSVTSITYYDTANSSQTLASSNYDTITSTYLPPFIDWSKDAVLPDTYDRPDAITLTYVTGWASRDTIPDAARQAIKLHISARFHESDPDKAAKVMQASLNTMAAYDWGSYR